MSRLFLIRHAQPEALWGGDNNDPGLTKSGKAEAEATAQRMGAHGVMKVFTSPLKRARETAAPIAQTYRSQPIVEPRIGEVAAPPGTRDRRKWLDETFPWGDQATMRKWGSVEPALQQWRQSVLQAATSLTEDAVFVTHYIAINVLVGAAMKSDFTVVCRPEFASITEMIVEDGQLIMLFRGEPIVASNARPT
ncbi:histidine phosphatase family protein [Terricaulis sp.]|uniref:histidine phosphatase family protein n=1 Tax=Terricaulis sp. TaxID=2768686 RepID=UPI0037851BF6